MSKITVELDVEAGQRKIIWQAKDFSIREFLTMKNDRKCYLLLIYWLN